MPKKKTSTTTRKKAARKAAGPVGVPERGVRVRMYRYGFGDCFLLSFGRGKEHAPFHVVIDCGLLPGSPEPARVREAVADIAAETAGRVDVLVCTHEHADHLSGFNIARTEWERIQIGELWLAWTEDPGDPLAVRLRASRERRRLGLEGVKERLAACGVREGWGARAALEVEAALSFFGASGSVNSTAAALEFVRSRVPRPRYFMPGDLETPGGLEGVRFYVLGPPRDEKLIRKDAPSSAEPEVYHAHEDGALTADAAFFAAAGADPGSLVGSEDERTCRERAEPFEAAFRIPRDAVARSRASREAKTDPAGYLHHLYDAAVREEPDGARGRSGARENAAAGSEQDWRRIEDDWLGVAGSMALKLDSDTNNTSLVLAIELEHSGEVLLFPGDAQVGNWLSWDQCAWSVPQPGAPARRVDASDLLARTVLYKVGHHGSHNATLREKGLERMRSSRLVAMIPVVQEVAARQGRHGWKMPFEPLLDALERRSQGRVIRADSGVPARGAAWFRRAARQTPLYVEFVVRGD